MRSVKDMVLSLEVSGADLAMNWPVETQEQVEHLAHFLAIVGLGTILPGLP